MKFTVSKKNGMKTLTCISRKETQNEYTHTIEQGSFNKPYNTLVRFTLNMIHKSVTKPHTVIPHCFFLLKYDVNKCFIQFFF
ncbi:hypothetical protein HanIR_Chr11g0509511 [Helianthus annuus]|nr:hypothetical protein HanIR_Chr11g0509511 [Helianthus annuus]